MFLQRVNDCKHKTNVLSGYTSRVSCKVSGCLLVSFSRVSKQVVAPENHVFTDRSFIHETNFHINFLEAPLTVEKQQQFNSIVLVGLQVQQKEKSVTRSACFWRG